MSVFRPFLVLIVIIVSPIFVRSQVLDPSFSAPTPLDRPGIWVVKFQADGKILLGGSIDFYGDEQKNSLIRLNADGTLDNEFTYPLADRLKGVRHIEVQSNGQLVVDDYEHVYTLDTNGNVLNTFTTVGTSESITAIKTNVDGKTLVAGYLDADYSEIFLRRHNADGSIDNSFSAVVNQQIFAIQIQNENVVVSGLWSPVARYDDQGNLDQTFQPGPFGSYQFNSLQQLNGVAVQPDGKIIWYNDYFFYYNYAESSVDMIRNAGTAISEEVLTGVQGPIAGIKFFDEKIYVQRLVGYMTGASAESRITRLNADGTLDHSFTEIPSTYTIMLPTFDISNDGSIIVVNSAFGNTFGINKYDADGNVISEFDAPVKKYGSIQTIKATGDNKLIVSGAFIKMGDHFTNDVARLNLDGTPDHSFTVTVDDSYVTSHAVANDGAVLISGVTDVFKVDATGALDAEFDLVQPPNRYSPQKMKTLNDGRLVFIHDQDLYILHPDGAIDFILEGSVDASSAVDFAVQPDGKILVCSAFVNWDVGPTTYKIVRLNTDGSFDNSFSIGSGLNEGVGVWQLLLVPSGGFIVTGAMTSFNGTPVAGSVVKVNNDGSVDETFTTNYGPSFWEVTNDPFGFLRADIGELNLIRPDGTVDENFQLPAELTVSFIEDLISDESSVFIVGDHIANGATVFISKLIRKPFSVGSVTIANATEDTPFEVSAENVVLQAASGVAVPADFEISVGPGENYSVNGNMVTPAPNYNGPLTIFFEVVDGSKTLVSTSFTMNVTAVNDVPVISQITNVVVNEDQPASFSLGQVVYTDIDTSPANLQLQIIDGEHYSVIDNKLVPDSNFNGPIQVSVKLNDSEVSSAPFTFETQVNPVNDKPVITQVKAFTTNEEQSVAVTIADITYQDVDGQPAANFSFSLKDGANYTLSGSTVNPAKDFSGTLQIPMAVYDGSESSVDFIFSVVVLPINDPPVLGAVSAVSIPEDTPYKLTKSDLSVTDADNANSELSLLFGTGDNFSIVDGRIVPTQNFTGSVDVPVFVSDNSASSNTQLLHITITAVNDAPVVVSAAQNLKCSKVAPLALSIAHFIVSDPDDVGDFTLGIEPGLGYDIVDNTIIPHSEGEGDLIVTIKVSDGELWSQAYNFDVHVLPVIVTDTEATHNEFSVWPNPTANRINYSPENNWSVRLTDLSGRVVGKDESNSGSIDLSHLASGVYVLEKVGPSNTTTIFRIIKQ
jgi:uncharacterized delta-60 repeat protein